MRKHNSNHKGFTGGVGDWKIVYTERHDSETDARNRESQIKKWKSTVMIKNLIAKHSSTGTEHPDFLQVLPGLKAHWDLQMLQDKQVLRANEMKVLAEMVQRTSFN